MEHVLLSTYLSLSLLAIYFKDCAWQRSKMYNFIEFDGKTGGGDCYKLKRVYHVTIAVECFIVFFEDYLFYSCRYQAWFMVQKLYLFIWKYSLIIKNYIKYSSRYRDVCIVLKYLIFSPIMSGVQFSDIDKSR